MRSWLMLMITLALLTTTSTLAESAPVISRTPGGFLMATAPNGQIFLVRENRAAPLAIVNTWFQVGARNELPTDEGISHFLEHMLFDGTTVRSKDEFDTYIFKNALQRNASTSYDWTNYYLQGPADRLEAMIAIHAEMLKGPALLDEQFTREREVVKEELRRAQDNPSSWLFRQMLNATWSHANYDHQVLGTMESLNGQSNQQMRDYFAKHYGPNNAITVAIGDFDAEAVLEELMRAFADWPRRTLPLVPAVGKDPQTAPRQVVLDGAFETTTQMLTFKAPPYAAAETYAADLAMTILGQGESSRLTRRLRDELGLVASISASNYSKIDGSTWYVTWQLLDPSQASAAADAVLEVLARFRMEGPTAEELQIAKKQIAMDRVMEGENLLTAARSVGSTVLALGIEGYETYLDRIYGATVQDVQWVAQQFFTSSKATLGIIGPTGTAAPSPNWALLDVPVTPLVAPRDLGRRGQSPLSQLQQLAHSLDAAADAETYQLANGMTIHLRPSTANATVALSLGVRGGLLWEDWHTNGLATLTLDTLTAGTTRRSKAQLAKELDLLGGRFSTSAGRDDLGIRATLLASDWQTGLRLLHEVTTSPTFPDEEVRQSQARQLQAIAASRDDMLRATMDQVRFAMFGPDSPYGRPDLGRESVVRNLTRADCARFHATLMQPEHLVLSVVGLFNPAQIKPELEATFGTLSASPHSRQLPDNWQQLAAPTLPEGTKRLLTLKEKAQSVIVLGVPSVGMNDPDFARMQVLHTILGSSGQARLHRRLRGQEGLAYTTNTALFAGQGTGSLMAHIATRPAMYEQAVTGLRREFRLLASEGPTPEEVEDAINYLASQTAQAHQGHAALANFAASNLAKGLPVDFQWRQLEAVRQVTLEAVQEAAAQYLQLDQHWLAVSGPLYEAARPLE